MKIFSNKFTPILMYSVLLGLLLIESHVTFAQPCYVQKGISIKKIENCSLEGLKISGWSVRLYKKGAIKSGTNYWGVIKGNSALDVTA